MDFKFDLPKLEEVFSENFSSTIYLLLASEYLKNNDIGRAETVLKIGTEHHPDNMVGKYLQAKIYLLNNEINKSQSTLLSILEAFPIHLKARKLLIEIYRKRNDYKNIDKNVAILQKHFPNSLELNETKVRPEAKSSEKNIENKKNVIYEEVSEKPKVSISENMATFTFVDILVSQKHYSEAMLALNILEKKGRSLTRINKKRKEIKKKIG